jgi:RNA-directed DNA polymerase
LNDYLRGWWNYYRFAKLSIKWLRSLHGWIMRRLRSILWKQWKNPRTRVRELKKRGICHRSAVSTGNARKGSWRMSRVKWVIIALPNVYFRRTLGLFLPGIQLLS